MENQNKKRSFGMFLKRTLPTFALIAILVLALVIPVGAVNAYPTLKNDVAGHVQAQRVLTPFTLYGNLAYYGQEPWYYGVDYTTCSDPTMFYDFGQGGYHQYYQTDNRGGDNQYEAEEYTISILQGVFGGYAPIYGADDGIVGTAYAYNNIFTQDGGLQAGGADDTGFYANHTTELVVNGGGYFVTYDMFVNDVISTIHIAPYYRAEVLDATDLTFATATYTITYLDSYGKSHTFTYDKSVSRTICESNIVLQAVNSGSRTPWYGYLRSSDPGTAGEFMTCEIPVIPAEFRDDASLTVSGEAVYVVDANVTINGFNRDEYLADPTTATMLPLAPICEVIGNPYTDGFYTDWYIQPFATFFNGTYDIGFSQGFDEGFLKGYAEGENASMSAWSLSAFLGTAIGGFLDTPLFGFFSIGGMLAVVIGLALLIVFLKFFAGG